VRPLPDQMTPCRESDLGVVVARGQWLVGSGCKCTLHFARFSLETLQNSNEQYCYSATLHPPRLCSSFITARGGGGRAGAARGNDGVALPHRAVD
jgi:hypothetical protein